MDKIKLHVPTCQFGFIEVEREFALENRESLYKEAIEDFKALKRLWDAPCDTKAEPTYLGQVVVENGHVYKAVMNEKTKKLYWLIDEV